MLVDRQMRRIVIAANVRRPDTPPHRLRHVHSGTGTGKRIDNDVAGFRKEPQQILHHLRRHGAKVGLAAGILVSRRELPNIEVWRESGGAFPKSFDFAPPIHRKTVAWSVPSNAGGSRGGETKSADAVLVSSRRELPDIEVLAGVGWPVFRICGFPAKPFVDSRFASSPERRIFLADDLSDIALAVTVEPQVIGAILHGTLLFGTCVLGPALDRIATDTKKLSEIGDAFRNRRSPSDIQSPPDLAAPRARSFPLARVGR